MPMTEVNVLIHGTSPMMMNRVPDHVLMAMALGTPQKSKAKKGLAKTADEVAEEHLYRFGPEADRYVGLPLKNLFSALISAGRQVRLDGKRQLSTKDSTLLTGVLMLESLDPVTMDEPHVRLIRPVTTAPTEAWGTIAWTPNIMRGRNPNGGEMVAICRPLIADWALQVRAVCDTDFMDLSRYRELFDICGRFIGLCEYRPERKGQFGKFRVDRWEAVER
jgi:hypothetical protein